MLKRPTMKLVVAIIALVALGACTPEGKVKSAVKDHVIGQINTEFDKSFGAKDSKIMNELKSTYTGNMSVDVADMKIEGDTATGKVSVTAPGKDFAGLVLLVGLGAQEHDKQGRNIASIMDQIRKEKPEVPAIDKLPKETETRSFKAEKKDGYWVVTEMKKI